MNENTNEVANIESTKKKVEVFQQNLKFTSEENKQIVTGVINSGELEGLTNGDKVASAFKVLLDEGKRAEVLKDANQTLTAVFQSEFIQLDLLTKTMNDKFEALMTVANLEVTKVRNELTTHFEKKVERLENANTRLEDECKALKEENAQLLALLETKDHAVVEADARVKDMSEAVATKDLSIKSLQDQLASKDDLVTEFKEKATKLNDTIAQMTQASQDDKVELKELQVANKELTSKSTDDANEINKLSNQLDKANIELEHANKDAKRFEAELGKVESKHETELAKIESRHSDEMALMKRELELEKSNNTQMQNQLLDLMKSMNAKPEPVAEAEDETGKDSAAVVEKPKKAPAKKSTKAKKEEVTK